MLTFEFLPTKTRYLMALTEKEILALDSKKHVKIYLLHTLGLSRKDIAKKLGTNPGHVGNEIKAYAKSPEKVKAALALAGGEAPAEKKQSEFERVKALGKTGFNEQAKTKNKIAAEAIASASSTMSFAEKMRLAKQKKAAERAKLPPKTEESEPTSHKLKKSNWQFKKGDAIIFEGKSRRGFLVDGFYDGKGITLNSTRVLTKLGGFADHKQVVPTENVYPSELRASVEAFLQFKEYEYTRLASSNIPPKEYNEKKKQIENLKYKSWTPTIASSGAKTSAFTFTIPHHQKTPFVSAIDNPKKFAYNEEDMLLAFLEYAAGIDGALALAANQVLLNGTRLKDRFTAIGDDAGWFIAINPKIESEIGKSAAKKEECLSFPGKICHVTRYPELIVSYHDINGKQKSKSVKGLEAQVWQHEIDHLNGVEWKVAEAGLKFHMPSGASGKHVPVSGYRFKKTMAECHELYKHERSISLRNLIDYPELFKEYPAAGGMRVHFENLSPDNYSDSHFEAVWKDGYNKKIFSFGRSTITIKLNFTYYEKHKLEEFDLLSTDFPEYSKEAVLLHELQHVRQAGRGEPLGLERGEIYQKVLRQWNDAGRGDKSIYGAEIEADAISQYRNQSSEQQAIGAVYLWLKSMNIKYGNAHYWHGHLKNEQDEAQNRIYSSGARTAEAGVLVGPTDINGREGIQAELPNGDPIKLGGGEIIMNEKASTEHCEALSEMNESTGGVAFDCALQKEGNTDRASGKMDANEWHNESAAGGKKISDSEKDRLGEIWEEKSTILSKVKKGQFPSEYFKENPAEGVRFSELENEWRKIQGSAAGGKKIEGYLHHKDFFGVNFYYNKSRIYDQKEVSPWDRKGSERGMVKDDMALIAGESEALRKFGILSGDSLKTITDKLKSHNIYNIELIPGSMETKFVSFMIPINEAAAGGKQVEDFIKKWNLTGKDAKLKFRGEPGIWFSKNIHTNGRQIWVYRDSAPSGIPKNISDIIEINGTPVSMAGGAKPNDMKKTSTQDDVIFTVDDDKLDQILHDFHHRELDYINDRGDTLYKINKRDYDRFIDYAISSGFDTVALVQEFFINNEGKIIAIEPPDINPAGEPFASGKVKTYFDPGGMDWKLLKDRRDIFSEEDILSCEKHGGTPIAKYPYVIHDGLVYLRMQENYKDAETIRIDKRMPYMASLPHPYGRDLKVTAVETVTFASGDQKYYTVVEDGHTYSIPERFTEHGYKAEAGVKTLSRNVAIDQGALYYLKLHNIITDSFGKSFKITHYRKEGIGITEVSDITGYTSLPIWVDFADLKTKVDSKKLTFKWADTLTVVPYETDRDKALLDNEIKGIVDTYVKDELDAAIGSEKYRAEVLAQEKEALRSATNDTIAGMEELAGGGKISKVGMELILDATSAAYSYDTYGEKAWRKSIENLHAKGYTEEEIAWILNSKYMRWAKEDNRPATGNEIIKYRETYGIDLSELHGETKKIKKIPNAYDGKAEDEVWTAWNHQQREHFLTDHNLNIEIAKKTWAELRGTGGNVGNIYRPFHIELAQHIAQGSYAGGGNMKKFYANWEFTTKPRYGYPLSSEVDDEVNISALHNSAEVTKLLENHDLDYDTDNVPKTNPDFNGDGPTDKNYIIRTKDGVFYFVNTEGYTYPRYVTRLKGFEPEYDDAAKGKHVPAKIRFLRDSENYDYNPAEQGAEAARKDAFAAIQSQSDKGKKGKGSKLQKKLMKKYATLCGFDAPPIKWKATDYTAAGWKKLIKGTKMKVGKKIDKKQVAYFIQKFKDKMSQSTIHDAADWVDGIGELNAKEKNKVWDGIQGHLDLKSHVDREKLPVFLKSASGGAKTTSGGVKTKRQWELLKNDSGGFRYSSPSYTQLRWSETESDAKVELLRYLQHSGEDVKTTGDLNFYIKKSASGGAKTTNVNITKDEVRIHPDEKHRIYHTIEGEYKKHWFSAKTDTTKQNHQIKGGAVSKLDVWRGGHPVGRDQSTKGGHVSEDFIAGYYNKWDWKPKTAAEKKVVNEIIAMLNKMAKETTPSASVGAFVAGTAVYMVADHHKKHILKADKKLKYKHKTAAGGKKTNGKEWLVEDADGKRRIVVSNTKPKVGATVQTAELEGMHSIKVSKFISKAAGGKKISMKKYEVTIWLVVNPSRDSDLETPETKQVEFIVEAENENEAKTKAKEMDDSKLSVWESEANEIQD